MIKRVFLLFVLATGNLARAQEEGVSEQLEIRAESAEEGEEEGDDLIPGMQHFRKHPLNLNTASATDLQSLQFLTDLHISHFLRYRNLAGPLISVYELQAVPAWDLLLIHKVRPFVTVANGISLKNEMGSRLRGGGHYLLFRTSMVLEKQKGFDRSVPGGYWGSRPRLLLRHRYSYANNFQYGFTAEKDSGEPFFRKAQKGGFDFYAGHFFVRNIGHMAALAIGDFSVNMGQGLLQWQTLAFGKGADVINIKRQSPVLKPYTGTGELAFNRGVGATVRSGYFEATGFVSSRKVSGNAYYDTTTGVEAVSSLLVSGLYRTEAELEDRYNLRQTSWGVNLQYKRPMVQVGLNAVRSYFSKPLKGAREPYNRFALQGNEWFHYSCDYGITFGNGHFFGEIARNERALAALGGVLVAANSKVDVALLYRNISAQYGSLWGNAFTEASLPANEKGLYTGITLRASPRLSLALYADHFSFPFPRFGISAPSSGSDYFVQMAYVPSKNARLSLRWRAGSRQANDGTDDPVIEDPVEERRQSMRVHLIRKISTRIALKARADVLWLRRESETEEAFLLYTEADVFISSALGMNARILFFDTEGYDSRLYAYESDVFSAGSVLPFYHSGFRYYTNVSYARKRWSLWVRLAQTRYNDLSRVGTGGEEVHGNKKSEVKVQIRYSF